MRISFGHVTGSKSYPLTRDEIRSVVTMLADDVAIAIVEIRYICSMHGYQLGRVVSRASGATITINFCTSGGVSQLLSRRRRYLDEIHACGGVVNLESGDVLWPSDSAKKYAVYVLAHEIGHLAYAKKYGNNRLDGRHKGGGEEKWCDAYAEATVARFEKDVLRRARNGSGGGMRSSFSGATKRG